MKLALLADLHANLDAVRACLAHARRAGADQFAFLGDLVGYGAEPRAVIDLVAEHAARGAVVVRGNHDQAVLDADTGQMNREAEGAIAWTRAQLGEAERRFLSGLPLAVRQEDRLFVHASADHPAAFTYLLGERDAAACLDATGATFVLAGHVHQQALFHAGRGRWPAHFQPVPGVAIPVSPRRRWVAVVGSAGQPRDGDPAACYALLETGPPTLTFHRVSYDWTAAVARIRAAGLPEALARRLETGT